MGEAGYINVQGCKHQRSSKIRAAQHTFELSSSFFPLLFRYRVVVIVFAAVGWSTRLFPRLDILLQTLDVALQPLDGGLKRLYYHRVSCISNALIWRVPRNSRRHPRSTARSKPYTRRRRSSTDPRRRGWSREGNQRCYIQRSSALDLQHLIATRPLRIRSSIPPSNIRPRKIHITCMPNASNRCSPAITHSSSSHSCLASPPSSQFRAYPTGKTDVRYSRSPESSHRLANGRSGDDGLLHPLRGLERASEGGGAAVVGEGGGGTGEGGAAERGGDAGGHVVVGGLGRYLV
jgi:hypothetical protein